MIDPHWQVRDLDPVTWRNIGPFLQPSNYIRTAQPDEHGLFILHDNGTPLRVFDTARGERPDLGITEVNDPHTLAHTLYESGEWDRVHVVNKEHLASVSQGALQIKNRALTLDAYYHLIYTLLWQSPTGYVSVPAHPGEWNHFTYTQIQSFLSMLPDPASVALGVLEEDAVVIGVILEIRGGQIKLVTTFEALELDTPLTLSADSFEQLWHALEDNFAPPAAVLLCNKEAFDGLLQAEDKLMYLKAVSHAHPYYYRILQK